MIKLFFFYKLMMNKDLIDKISLDYELTDGYAMVHYYDKKHNILELGNNDIKRNVLLCGKIVSFNMSLYDTLPKINDIDECKFKNEGVNYKVETIIATDIDGNEHSVYIIY